MISIRADLSAATDVVVDDDDDVVADGFAASKTGLALPTSCASVEDVKLGAGHRGSCCVAPQLAAGPHTQSVILTASDSYKFLYLCTWMSLIYLQTVTIVR